MDKFTIELKDVKVRAFHGYYKEEQEIGSFFIVNLSVQYFAPVNQESSLENSIDYQKLFAIVTQEMKIVRPLLENLCSSILKQVELVSPLICHSIISIEKENPPIAHFNGRSVKVSLERKYEKH